MPIASSDIKYRLSTKSGSAGDTTAQSDPDASLGKYISTTEMDLQTTLNNLFDDVSGDENAAQDVEYRCVFVLNGHATLTLQAAKLWLASVVSGGADIAIGLDPTGVVDKDQATAQAEEVADEGTAPSGVSFSTPTTKTGGLSIGDIAPGYCQAIWLRRTATNSAAQNNDGATLRVEGDTAA